MDSLCVHPDGEAIPAAIGRDLTLIKAGNGDQLQLNNLFCYF